MSRCHRATIVILSMLSCIAAGGCAGAVGRGWTSSNASQAVQAAAQDETFPSAAEAGIAANEPTSTDH